MFALHKNDVDLAPIEGYIRNENPPWFLFRVLPASMRDGDLRGQVAWLAT